MIENGRVFIDAARDIRPGEELGYDYQIGRDKDDPPNVDEIYACRCGSPQCRGTMLWPPEEARARSAARRSGCRSGRRRRLARAAGRQAAPSAARARAGAPRSDEQLAARGFGVVDDFVDAGLLAELRAALPRALHEAGALRPARIGRGTEERLAPEVRGDFIAWLSEPDLDAEQRLLARFDELRMALNRGSWPGSRISRVISRMYRRGAAYARHFDRLAGTDIRAISAALYLNDDWIAGGRRLPAHLHRRWRE